MIAKTTLRLAALGCISLTSAFGSIILSVQGDPIETGGPIVYAGNSVVASFTSSQAWTNVDISVTLGGPPGIFDGTAFLTDAIGPGVTTANESAGAAFQADLRVFPFQGSFTVLQGLSLSPGTYYLTLSSTMADFNTSFNWEEAAHHTQITTAPGTTLGSYFESLGNSQAAYAPGSSYSTWQFSPLEFTVTGQPAPEPPSGWLMLSAAAIAGLLALLRRPPIPSESSHCQSR